MRNNKGITLISLVSSIILLFILASMTIGASLESFKEMKYEGAKSEIEEVQKEVDRIVKDYQTFIKEEENSTASYSDYFNKRYSTSGFDSKLLSKVSGSISNIETLKKYEPIKNAIDNPDSEQAKKVFYFSSDDLVKYFGLKGIDAIIVDFGTRSVYSVEGIKDPDDNTKIYYTQEDWGDKSKIESNIPEETAVNISVSKENTTSTVYNLKVTFNKKLLNDITKINYYIGTESSEKNLKNIKDFKIDNSGTNTVIRFSIPVKSGSYNFIFYDSLNNSYKKTSVSL